MDTLVLDHGVHGKPWQTHSRLGEPADRPRSVNRNRRGREIELLCVSARNSPFELIGHGVSTNRQQSAKSEVTGRTTCKLQLREH